MFSMIKKTLLVMTVVLFSIGTNAAEKPVYVGKGAAVSGYDTVAYFTQGKAVKGKKNISIKHLGETWRFSSEQNKAMFLASPEKYSPQYGGHCAFAMANGKLVSTDPKAFTVVDDRLYLNYSLSVRKRWSKDIPGYIADADENWLGF